MKPADALLSSYAKTRDVRDRLKDARNGCMCQRHEGVDFEDGLPVQQLGAPCWKAARKWDESFCDDEGMPVPFRFDPPISEWCDTCRQRQAFTEQLRVAVREHAAAKRAILQRGRALLRHKPTEEPNR